ncbi:BREX-2 system adenine-specific DNA-methyltransferase PglX [Haliangium sp.]|uniref:BREX-2 system adenine-specific DNA-methyltransferase PglX n=1 Tax=Haliangium sp. TaxID=2663208 RepID=UPI003D0EFC5F
MAGKQTSKAAPAGKRGRRGPAKGKSLTGELQALLAKTLVPDLAERAAQPAVAAALAREHERAKADRRTADSKSQWVARAVEQVGAAWVLSCVFVRTLEDRGLLEHRRLAGPGARDAEELFFRLAPSLTARDYLLTVFRELGHFPGVRDVMDAAHNPVWRLAPSAEGARALLDFFRRSSDDGELAWTFPAETGGAHDTRFLGDLYQDLSESVRKRYALLQTPDFVEAFILDHTLEPAVATFGLGKVRVIDPTCGSGHFLLGAYERLFEHHLRAAPGLDPRGPALTALGQVYGADLNPYAVAIARFRLTLAYLDKAGFTRLAHAPAIHPNLVVADSLLHGASGQVALTDQDGLSDETRAAFGDDIFNLEDRPAARRIFGQRYHAVVGNPPYITCKDKALRDRYRELYQSASGKYALAAPFTERFFQLAVDLGYVGMINANSFMKREFGKKLIQEVLPTLDLSRVVDTSGAYIPGHGTPTLLLFGRNCAPIGDSVPAVLGKRGEPTTPEQPADGRVWSSIRDHYDEIGFEDEFISVAEMPRATLGKHPWSLGGGGAAELKKLLEDRAPTRLGDVADSVGICSVTGEDDLYLIPEHVAQKNGIEHYRPMVVGEQIRDWSVGESDVAVFPYGDNFRLHQLQQVPNTAKYLWPAKAIIQRRKRFGVPMLERGLSWYELQELYHDKLRTPLTIAFAEVATHNHFVLDHSGKVFNRTAPIIKLPEDAGEDDHLALLAYLNSSTACFWMKQVSFDKGSGTDKGKWQDDPAKIAYQFAGTLLSELPVPRQRKEQRERLIALAKQALEVTRKRNDVISDAIRPPEQHTEARDAEEHSYDSLRERERACLEELIAIQEEIDWLVYELFGFIEGSSAAAENPQRPTVALGERPFEIVRAQRGEREGTDGHPLAKEVSSRYSEVAAKVWAKRIQVLRDDPRLSLIESPEYKRRWAITPKSLSGRVLQFDDRLTDAVESALHEEIEGAVKQECAAQRALTVRRVVQLCEQRPNLRRLCNLRGDNVETAVNRALVAESVPFLAVMRFKPSGLDKHAEWLACWEAQRREDAGEAVGDIPVPPKYASKDFASTTYWQLRGKLDVPKERFISYPGCESDDSPGPLFGWAGWNHLERAQALAGLYQERKDQDGWDAARLTPMLAGLLELVPWLKQWHNQPDPAFDDLRLGDYFEQFLEGELSALGLTKDDLRAWRPAKKSGRGRKAGTKRRSKARE